MAKAVLRTSLLTLVVLALVSSAVAGGRETPDPLEVPATWKLQFEGSVMWQRVTPLGALIVGSTSGLYGVDPVEGRVLWRHGELSRLAPEGYREILNTSCVIVSEADGDAHILDTLDGRILFDSRAADLSMVLSTHLLPRDRSLLIFGLKQGVATTTMMLVDIESGATRWVNNDILAGASKMAKLATALFQASSGESGIVSEPYELTEGAFLLASGTGIYKVSTDSGKFLWKQAHVDGATRTRFFSEPGISDVFYAATQADVSGSPSKLGEPRSSGTTYTYYSAHRDADGGALWHRPVRIKGGVNDIIPIDRGLILTAGPGGSGRIRFVDRDTGISLWDKKTKIKVPGSVVDHDVMDEGILIASGADSAWTNKGVVYYVNILDVDSATLRFKKPHQVKGRLLSTDVIGGRVLYVTTSEVNFLDPASGRPIHKRPVQSDGNLVTVTRGDRMYAFSQDSGMLSEIGRDNGTMRALSTRKIALADKDVPDLLEIDQDRLVLSSAQNIVAFDSDGAVQFQAHHPAPRRSTIMRVLLTAEAVRAAMASASSGVYSGSFARAASEQEDGTLGRTMATEIAHGYADMAEGYGQLSRAYVRAANERFKASAQIRDYVFMMVELPKSGVALAKVSKRDGEVVGRIHLGKDKEPSYAVDSISGRVFYLAAPNQIQGYVF